MRKKLVSWVLALCLVVSLLPAPAQAVNIVASGSWGDDNTVTWTLDSEGTLTFDGTGKMMRAGPFNVDGEMQPTDIISATKK